jgi:hypothetical protein
VTVQEMDAAIRDAVKKVRAAGVTVRSGSWGIVCRGGTWEYESPKRRCCAVSAYVMTRDCPTEVGLLDEPLQTAAKELGVDVQWLSAYVVGFDGGQLMAGPTPDRADAWVCGRRLGEEVEFGDE